MTRRALFLGPWWLLLLVGTHAALGAPVSRPATLRVTGDWQIEVTVPCDAPPPGGTPKILTETLAVSPAALLTIQAERHASLPVFNPQAGGWNKGPALERVRAQECATLHLLVPESLTLRAGPEPDAPRLELLTEAWGGRNTGSYLAEPPGSAHNYRETVLAAKPDLVVSEFVNDAGLSPEQVETRYSKLLADFQAIGAEWIILTPHYVRPDWMGLTKERDIDDDPRPYVQGLRRFAASRRVALADASQRYGRLWRQGLPYSTLMLNSINHPDARGMRLFADSLMALFPAR